MPEVHSWFTNMCKIRLDLIILNRNNLNLFKWGIKRHNINKHALNKK